MTNNCRNFASGLLISILLAACGGGGDSSPPPPPPPVNNPPPAGGIGSAGGTVTGSSGAKVVIPAGALAANVDIAITESGTGAPAMPGALAAVGPIFAFTPHGTTFATPVTVTVPFDPTKLPAGATPALYKTDATQSAWVPVAGATVNGNSISGDVTGFSFFAATLLAFNDTYEFEQTPITGASTGSGPLLSKSRDFDAPYKLKDIGLAPPLVEKKSGGKVHVSSYGTVYWTSAVAPLVDFSVPSSPASTSTTLTHLQLFKKTASDAHLQLQISQMTSELMDSNTRLPDAFECPGILDTGGSGKSCYLVLQALNSFDVHAWIERAGGVTIDLAHGDIYASINGYIGNWNQHVGDSDPQSTLKYSAAPHFDYNPDVDNFIGTHARHSLKAPILIDIPLDAVKEQEQFIVSIEMNSLARNHRGGDAFAGAWLHDPQATSGASYSGSGIEPVAATLVANLIPPVPPQTPAPSCPTGSDPAAGIVQFAEAETGVPEQGIDGAALIAVTRSGGGQGEVSVLFTTHDLTAHAGVDYTSVNTLVRFADGDQTTRFLRIPIADNADVNDARTVSMELSDLRGCATFGSTTTATLTIEDDDHKPAPVQTYALSGTVSGLMGTGLSLRDVSNGETLVVGGNGAFTFDARLASGLAYDVRINAQPNNPLQACAVANGSGVVPTSDVTNITVTCDAPAPVGSLDPSFGGGGKITSTSTTARSVALQADGKSVVVAGLSISRFNTDGSPDTTFGTAGSVAIVANGGGVDAMEAIAVQADGKILVGGHTVTALPSQVEDFTVQRFNANGTLDASFGSGGKVVTDFSGAQDAAYALALQGDGKILLAGYTTMGSGVNIDQDMAVVRYLADGTLDASFGTGGKASANVAGKSDFGLGIALQSDGKMVVVGRVFPGNSPDPDCGFARFTATGQLDGSFGTGGTLKIAFAANTWDEADDVVIQSDGRIVAGGYVGIGGIFQFALLRLDTDGTPDAAFGSNGRASTTLTARDNLGRALALQADGKIVIAGVVSSLANGDFGVARFMTNGALDTGFGTSGLVDIDFFGSDDYARDLAIQSDGKILVVGSARGSSFGLAMARIAP